MYEHTVYSILYSVYHCIKLLLSFLYSFLNSYSTYQRYLDATNPGNVRYSAIFPNLFSAGFLNIPVQLPDNLLFLYAYIALSTFGQRRRYLTRVGTLITTFYIVFVLLLPFFAPATFMPLIVDENTDDYSPSIGLPLIQGNLIGYLAYNFYFSIIFFRVIYRIYFDAKAIYPPLALEISLKCLLHFLVSSTAVLLFFFLGVQQGRPEAGAVYTIMIMSGLHFIFNTKRYQRHARPRYNPVVPALSPPNSPNALSSPNSPNSPNRLAFPNHFRPEDEHVLPSPKVASGDGLARIHSHNALPLSPSGGAASTLSS